METNLNYIYQSVENHQGQKKILNAPRKGQGTNSSALRFA